jgi:CopG family nickel-responsive transcriptional regulator
MSGKEPSLVRFGVSMPDDLAERFDRMIAAQGYENRSEAIRDLNV